MTWFKSAAVVQIITGLIHSLSFLFEPKAQNETEKQLLNLMTTYQNDLGFGFSPTQMDLFLALSSCFSLMYLFGGISNFFLLRKNIDVRILRELLIINILFFGTSFVIMFFMTFLYPVILTGLTFVLLVVSYFTIGRGIRQN